MALDIIQYAGNRLYIIVVAIVAVLFILLIIKIKSYKKREQRIIYFKESINNFFEELSVLQEHYVTYFEENAFISKWQNLYSELSKFRIPQNHKATIELVHFKNEYKSLHNTINISNEKCICSESAKYDDLLSNIDGKSLDIQQRTAVIADDERILVLAGAGSGKTLTIAAKVKYLVDIKNINPQEILLISFTKKSAQEMTERIQNKLGIPVEATTFHKLGLDIIKQADGFRPDISDENEFNQFVHNFFETRLLEFPSLIKSLTEYFAYFLEIPDDLEKYSSLGELYEQEKTADLETLKSKYDREKYLAETSADKAKLHQTLNNENVKSLEETKIANFLFMHGIKYEYERLYPFESDDPLSKSYRPDFYLTDYDIYLEHFGITKDFRVPWLSKVEERKYLDGIKWKREFHSEHNTKLIETYSYYNSEGVLLKKLEEILIANGVEFKSRDFVDVFNTVYASKSNKYFSEFIKLCCTFITLFKSDNYKVEHIENLRQEYMKNEADEFLCERTNMFLDIIKFILVEYQKHLESNNAIDFSDMINNAADKINSGCEVIPYKYVIVDEYQDISKSRFNFLKAIADRTGAKLFCVGDDWQSIYRFAGSDISLFTDFERYFGSTKILKIEKTYRNSQQLIDEAARFVLRNPLQLRKNLRSDKKLNYPLVFWGFNDDPTQALQLSINKIASEFGNNSSILLLGRTNYDIEIAKKTGLFRISRENQKEQLKYIPFPDLKIDFLSVHKSKGLEADNVIILNFKNDKLGFPNQIADDDVLNLVLTNSESYRFAEERRLFYVAITRTKNRTYILTDNKNPSVFFKEFTESESVCFASIEKESNINQTKCPVCKTGNLLKVQHDGKYFIGCTNFPKCTYTLRDATILLNPKKCPSCGGFLVKRSGKNGHWFVGCTNYPYCNYTEQIIRK
ncbi:MAG: UvrD-helicase domain-containing protein [Salinivirgaceae bacterium]|nr:UvrD-helicase domain-containing protein [Salinivirgaceae bacterium]